MIKSLNSVLKIEILDSNDYGLFKETFLLCLAGFWIEMKFNFQINYFFVIFKNKTKAYQSTAMCPDWISLLSRNPVQTCHWQVLKEPLGSEKPQQNPRKGKSQEKPRRWRRWWLHPCGDRGVEWSRKKFKSRKKRVAACRVERPRVNDRTKRRY